MSLAHFSIPMKFVTCLPDNAIAHACIASLRVCGLDMEEIVFGSKRLGLYYWESDVAFRNSNVVYVAGKSFWNCVISSLSSNSVTPPSLQ